MLPLAGRPRPDEPVLSTDSPSVPVLVDTGTIDLECWRCRFPICQGLHSVVEASNRLYRCPACSALNRSPV